VDDLAAFNRARWEELARRGVLYGRPLLDLTPASARAFLDPYGVLPDLGEDLRGRDVLCLASGGGQQSAAFAVLGARVSVLDLTPAMLAGDRRAAAHYRLAIDAQAGDMRDLSRYADRSFDLVWQPYSINFIPDPRPVFAGVARVLRPGGFYHLQIHNPFVMATSEETWNGQGYLLAHPYVDGAEIQDPDWTFMDEQGQEVRVPGPRAFRHNLGTVINALSGLGFQLRGLWEEISPDEDAAPGSWEHYLRVAPPWFTFWFAF
jgi:SAM-dependent methyltransferase